MLYGSMEIDAVQPDPSHPTLGVGVGLSNACVIESLSIPDLQVLGSLSHPSTSRGVSIGRRAR